MPSGAAPGVIRIVVLPGMLSWHKVQLEHVIPHAVQDTWFSCLIIPVFYYTDTSIVGSIPWEKCQHISCKNPMKNEGHHRSDCWALSYELGDGHHCERCFRETSRRSRDGGMREEGAVKQHALVIFTQCPTTPAAGTLQRCDVLGLEVVTCCISLYSLYSKSGMEQLAKV